MVGAEFEVPANKKETVDLVGEWGVDLVPAESEKPKRLKSLQTKPDVGTMWELSEEESSPSSSRVMGWTCGGCERKAEVF